MSATISPALRGGGSTTLSSLIDGAGVTDMWPNIWPLILIGMVSIPLGLEVFRRGERYAKKHGKLKRSG